MPFRLPENELAEEFFRPAAGPGGQHLNKTSNGVRLVFDFHNSPSLPASVKSRLEKTAAPFLSGGKLMILSIASRSLKRNREDARLRMESLVVEAFKVPRKRKKTRPTRASAEKRLAAKARRAVVKSSRRKVERSGD